MNLSGDFFIFSKIDQPSNMRFLLGVGLCLLPLLSFSQEKCGFVKYHKHLSEVTKATESEAVFEQWMQQKQQELHLLKGTTGRPQKGEPTAPMRAAGTRGTAAAAKFVIPVVVHVIHHGEEEGQGANIPKEQILSQIKTLNDDFRALNSADINKLPADFKALAADTEIEFVLAKQDPEGVFTDGIVRVASSEVNWEQSEDLKLKALSQWPSDKYLNLYTADLSHPLLGWAQFPQSSQLAGLNIGDGSEASDGVVLDYQYVGSGYQANNSSKGRTATHEMGHYLGLRHIWGDGDCSSDDYVTDTPLVEKSNQGCPKAEDAKSCSNGPAMYQNYMDYTDDGCMALFTPGQKERMFVVLQNSPRRKDLNNSIGKQEPVLVANDAGVRSLLLSPSQACNNSYTPTIELRNYGNNQVTQVQVNLKVDNAVVKTYSLSTKLDYLQTQTIKLDEVVIANAGQRLVAASVTLTNNRQDGKSSNNTATYELNVPLKTSLPVTHDFQKGFYPFYVINPDRSFSWQLANVSNGTTTANTAAFINFYDYAEEGQRDILASPILDLRAESKLFVALRAAYARFDRSSEDGLEIYVSTDCSASLQTAKLAYRASGEALASASPTTNPFQPLDASHWSSIGLDLSAYAGLPHVQLLFVGVNGYGNNLYLDDIQFSSKPLAALNVTLAEIVQPTAVFGNENVEVPLTVQLRNSGSDTIHSLSFKVTLNDSEIQQFSVQDLNLPPQAEKSVAISLLQELSAGPHIIKVQAYSPNGGVDGISSDNIQSKQVVVNNSQKRVPLRESFAIRTFEDAIWTSTTLNASDSGWISTPVLSPTGEAAKTNHAAAAKYSKSIWTQEKWMVSPILDFSNTWEAGMQFWYYAGGSGELALQLLASKDGGLSWSELLWEKSSTDLKPDNPAASVIPAAVDNWRNEFLNLQELAGEKKVRIALVATGRGTATAYVDEIEFFLSDRPTNAPLPERNNVSLFPNPNRGTYNLFFNMEDPNGEEVVVELMNSQGSFISRNTYPNTLNQIYTVDMPGIPAGVYYLRVRSASINTTLRMVLIR